MHAATYQCITITKLSPHIRRSLSHTHAHTYTHTYTEHTHTHTHHKAAHTEQTQTHALPTHAVAQPPVIELYFWFISAEGAARALPPPLRSNTRKRKEKAKSKSTQQHTLQYATKRATITKHHPKSLTTTASTQQPRITLTDSRTHRQMDTHTHTHTH
jgi:hypothetical protein